MNGAEALISTLVDAGVDTCFTNPGTTEMHLVAALAGEPRMKSCLCLFEGVATGAADGYARMARRPAATLLHLGPGLANGLANLHNARKAATPVFNIVGEHATWHRELGAPLAADIEGLAAPVSRWVGTADAASDVSGLARQALALIGDGQGGVATLVVANDAAWNETNAVEPEAQACAAAAPDLPDLQTAAEALKAGRSSLLLLGGTFITRKAAELAHSIRRKTGCRVMAEAAVARMQRGGGTPMIELLPFHVDAATKSLSDVETAVLAGARDPIAFFAYPGRDSRLLPDGTNVLAAGTAEHDLEAVLEDLDARLGGRTTVVEPDGGLRETPSGPLDLKSLAAAIAVTLPDNAIIVDESITSGAHIYSMTAAAASHDWIKNRGGSIGYSMPVSVGCAVACPDRRVVCLVGDGSAGYTLQALWTMARYGLDITVVVLANRSYRILQNEMSKIGAGEPGPAALELMTIDHPRMDWCRLAEGQGVRARSAATAQDLAAELSASYRTEGPTLIEASL